MCSNMEARSGKDISLLINKNSNYGLTHYKPIEDKNDRWYKRAELYQKSLDEEGVLRINIYDNSVPEEVRTIELTRDDAERVIKCATCAAERTNNFHRYCQKCEFYVDISKYRAEDK